MVFHVLNRAAGRSTLFKLDGDYRAFEQTLWQALEFQPIRLLSYCIMPNHWHMVLWPFNDGDLSTFMRWLTVTHTQRYHVAHETTGTGPLYQGRFKSFPVETDEYLLTLCRYVERNPVRARLVERALDWRWSSLWLRLNGTPHMRACLAPPPLDLPADWVSLVDQPETDSELEALRVSVNRGRPYGSSVWQNRIAPWLGLESTFRKPGRPPKTPSFATE